MGTPIIDLMDDEHLSSQSLFKQYYDAMVSRDINSAQNIISSNTSLQNQITNSDNVNKLISHVNLQEEGVKNNVDNYLVDLLDDFQTMINNTMVMGTWSSTVQYNSHNLVYYNDKGYYAYKQPPIGTLPTDTDYWLEYDIKGLQGYGGYLLNFRYNYDNSTTYNLGDVIIYQNKMWMAIATTQGVPPTLTHFPWALIMVPAVQKKTPITTTQPSGYAENSMWFDIYDGTDIQQTSWTQMAAENNIGYSSAVFAIGTNIYSVGGEGYNFYPANNNDCYDTLTNTWSSKTTPPQIPLGNNYAATIGNKGYIIAGETWDGTSRVYTNKTLIYDSVNNSWSYGADCPINAFTVVCSDNSNYIYALGAYSASSLTGVVYRYDITNNIWTQMTSMPTPLGEGTCEYIDGKIYVLGGYSSISPSNVVSNIILCYDVATNTWSQKASMGTSRADSTSFISPDNSAIYVVGGSDSLIYAISNNEKYTIATNTWTEEIPMIYPRISAGACTVGNYGYVIGGLILQYAQIVPYVERYTFSN